jgi:hypothetical protein
MRTIAILVAVVFLIPSLNGCGTLTRPSDESAQIVPAKDYSDQAELNAIRHLAVAQLGLKLDRVQRQGSEYNFLAVKSSDLLISRRLDSRTFFVQDERYGHDKENGFFQGSDEELKKACYRTLARLDIPEREVREANVLRESLQVGFVDRTSGKVVREEPRSGRRLARCSRQVEGVPIFSSHLILGLTKHKTIGFMEVHWPEIPEATIEEARRLQYMVKHGWQPPERKGASIESVEAGVIHSAATGFLMDIYPAVRVVYAPEKNGMGRKLVLHFDRHGNPVPVPREFDIPCRFAEKRGKK